MNCPNCGKPVINKDSLECVFCHTALYSDEKQIAKIKRNKRAKKIGGFFVVAIPAMLLWVGIICVVKFALNTPLPDLFTTKGETTVVADNTELSEDEYLEYDSVDVYDTTSYVPEYTTPHIAAPTAAPGRDTGKSNDTTSAQKNTTTTKATKPSKDKATEYKMALDAENQLHQDNVERINNDYDYSISQCQLRLEHYRVESGYASSSSILAQMDSLDEEIREKEDKLYRWMLCGTQFEREIPALEKEIEEDRARYQSLSIAYNMAVKADIEEGNLKSLISSKNSALSEETERHNQAVQEINAKYGK